SAFGNATGIFKKIGGIELVVAEELPGSAVEFVGAGFNRGIENSGAGAAILRAKAGGLHLEFLNSVYRRQYNEIGAIQKVHRVGVVVNAIKEIVVLCRAIAVCGESAGCSVPPSIGLGRVDAGRELRQERKVATIQGKVIDALGVHHLTDRRVLGLQHWR